MSTTAFAITAGSPTTRPGAPASEAPAADSGAGDFVAALDHATPAANPPGDAAVTAEAVAAAPASGSLPEATPAPPLASTPDGAADAPAPGWPPPGLSSLFPPMPLFATAAPALAAGAGGPPTTAAGASLPPTILTGTALAAARAAATSASAVSAQAAAKTVLVAGPETLPPEPLGPMAPLLAGAAAAKPAAPNAGSLAASAAPLPARAALPGLPAQAAAKTVLVAGPETLPPEPLGPLPALLSSAAAAKPAAPNAGSLAASAAPLPARAALPGLPAQAAAKTVLVAGPETLPPEPLGPLPALLSSAAAAKPAASNAGSLAASAAPLPARAALPGLPAQAAAKTVFVAGPETLPPEPLGPMAPLLAGAAAAKPAAPNAGSLAAAAAPNPALPGLAGHAADPTATALARAPVPLPLPGAEERALSGVAALADALAPERLPEGVAPLSQASASGLPRLDLAQAFPAPLPLPSPRFAEDLGARLQWVAEQQGGEATLRIAPEGLGPVEVRMKLDGDRVDLGFSASQQETRTALEQALPKLRDMLAQQGLLLGDASVGQQHAGNARDGDPRRATDLAEREREGDEGLTALARGVDASAVLARSTRGMLDLYA